MVFRSKPVSEIKADNQNQSMTFISKGSEISGDLHASGNLRVDGAIHGNVLVQGDIEVSAGGVIEGKSVSARNIVIHGLVKATLTAAEQLRIHSQGEVQGDVTAKSLDIESGARFIGYSHTGEQAAGKQTAEILAIQNTAKKETK
jgi:cytoskeletal protein CcmA (bactofilin family)